MKDIRHLVLTSFSLNHAADDEWLKRRWEIFMDVTYPSMMSQTVMDFTWIVGFSDLTSFKWKRKISVFNCKDFRVVYASWHSKTWKDISRNFCDQEYLLTTRLDSDDAFAETAVERIQQAFIDNPIPRVVNFLQGLITDGKVLYHLEQKSGAFISMLEPSDSAVTIRGGLHHPDAKGTPHYQSIDDKKPLWMVYVHDGVGQNIAWTMKWAREHPSLKLLSVPVTREVFDTFNTNLKFEDMKYESPN